MKDRFEGRSASMDGSAVDGFAITPDDVTTLAELTRAIYVGGAGDICVITESGTQLVFKNVGAATLLPVRAQIVKATGTTATDLLGLV